MQSSPVMSFMASSPPPPPSPPGTPSPQKKRKFGTLGGELPPQADFPPQAQFPPQAELPPQAPALKKRMTTAKREFYGVDIHQLLEDAAREVDMPKQRAELPTPPAEQNSGKPSLLWTEKYRAKKFTDLIGDERTHRAVMHWLKRWDEIVFPGSCKPKGKSKAADGRYEDEKPLRKILMLTGPPGLGKTTLAHVCAKQAGYEAQEINASDERSKDVVKGRIRDMVGTENVRGVDVKTANGKVRKAAKPVCVVVDEVDGVVGGSGGGGEGGFVKALIDLAMLDQKNTTALGTLKQAPNGKRRGDRFRLLRPLILICNDVYHPSLRPLRQSSIAEIIHVRKPPLSTIIPRMQAIFEHEGVPCEGDGVRRLCEAAWGVSNRKEDRSGSGAGEGDMRGIMVVGEWVAGKLRVMNDVTGRAKLTRRWIEEHILHDLQHGGGAARGLGRGGPKDIVDRVFREGAGFPRSSALATPQAQITGARARGAIGVAEGLKKTASERLRELIDAHGDTERIMTDCWSAYPDHPFQDDTLLSKPDSAYEWLNFHDRLSSAVYSGNEWELAAYLSQPVIAFHQLFASQTRSWAQNDAAKDEHEEPKHAFLGPQASWAAHEAQKYNLALVQSLQSSLSIELTRLFTSTADIATDLLPNLLRMLSPQVNPIIVGGSGSDKGIASVRKASERVLVSRAVQAMNASGVRLERSKVESGESWSSTWIYRMEPALDTLGTFETGGTDFGEAGGKTRYAVRQVLDQEFRKEELKRADVARMARFKGSNPDVEASAPATNAGKPVEPNKAAKVTRDFFGRVVIGSKKEVRETKQRKDNDDRVWASFHEGFSNAVRKPVTLAELMKDL